MSARESMKNAGNENKNSSNPLQNDRTYISGSPQTSAGHQFQRKREEKPSSKSKNN